MFINDIWKIYLFAKISICKCKWVRACACNSVLFSFPFHDVNALTHLKLWFFFWEGGFLSNDSSICTKHESKGSKGLK